MISSMTGYAQELNQGSFGELVWELRSINHRYLELHFKLPEEVRDLEYSLRELVRQKFGRGKIECLLKLNSTHNDKIDFKLNLPLIQTIITHANQIAAQINNSAPISPLELMRWPGVVQANNAPQIELIEAIKQAFIQGMQKLAQSRQVEGAQLATLIHNKLDAMVQQIHIVQQQLPDILAQQKTRLIDKINELSLSLDANRLEQEFVYLLHKADVVEEMERLLIHIAECKRVVNTENTVGRKLDFLLQEMNREANTLASKSVTTIMSTVAVELKVIIEQIREQVQNIE